MTHGYWLPPSTMRYTWRRHHNTALPPVERTAVVPPCVLLEQILILGSAANMYDQYPHRLHILKASHFSPPTFLHSILHHHSIIAS